MSAGRRPQHLQAQARAEVHTVAAVHLRVNITARAARAYHVSAALRQAEILSEASEQTVRVAALAQEAVQDADKMKIYYYEKHNVYETVYIYNILSITICCSFAEHV